MSKTEIWLIMFSGVSQVRSGRDVEEGPRAEEEDDDLIRSILYQI